MEGTQRGPAVTSATAARARLATIVLSAVVDGTFSAVHLWSAASLIVIIVVTAAVGLVVVRHQPRNPDRLAAGRHGISAVSTNSSVWEVLILGFAALPLSIGIGILKYRLYEIDRIISRTLAYAIVTGLLVGVYARLVLLATHVPSFHSTVAVAASTLAAAALFTPLRRRVQYARGPALQPGQVRRRPDRRRSRRPPERRR